MKLNTSPLDIEFKENSLFLENKKLEPGIRKLGDMRDVIYDAEFLEKADESRELYYMFRDVAREEDRDLIKKHHLRFDVTAIPSGTLGCEYVKTAGHYHPDMIPCKTFTEIYEVLEGKANYLLQRKKGEEVDNVVLVSAKKGDKLVIPSNYGHVTINPGKKTLVMSNWVCADFNSDYSIYKEKRGAAYFQLDDGELIANDSYKDLPGVVDISAELWEHNEPFSNTGNMYALFLKKPEMFSFLTCGV